MHRPFLLLVTALLGVASLLFTGLAMSIPNHSVKANDPQPAEQTVRRFYDAVNLQIRTGDSSALLDVLNANFVDTHPLPGFDAGAAGLIDHVAILHASAPDAEITVESIVATADEVFASVSVRNTGEVLETGFESASPVWSTAERFRIEGDRVIERSSTNQNLIVVQERFDLFMELDADLQGAFLATHWTFDATGSTRFQMSGGPATLHVLSGELAITVTSNASSSGTQEPVVHEPDSDQAKVAQGHEVVSLPQGSSAAVPGGVGFVLDTPNGAASALYVSRVGVSPLGPGSGRGSDESAGADARYLGAVPYSLGSEPSSAVRLHRIVLMPGALVSSSNMPNVSLAMMWLETGNVLTEHSLPPASGAGTVNTNRRFVSGVKLAPDDGLAYVWEPGATLHNTGNVPAVVWVLTVEPSESDMPS